MRWPRRCLVLLISALLAGGPGIAAHAQSSSPAGPAPTIEGGISGGLRRGDTLHVRVDATMPGGWRGLDLVEVVLLEMGREIERLTYDVESTRLAIGEDDVLTGTGDEGSGAYLAVRGPRVIVTTGGPYLSIQIHADVMRTLPGQTRFRLSATDDMGGSTQVTRSPATAVEEEGFGWDMVLAAAIGALLVGAFAGNLVASRRRVPPKLSVYGIVQRWLDAERDRAGPGP